MKMILERAQRTTGMMGNKQTFSISVRAEISDDEREAINKYRLADEILYVDGAAPRIDAESALSVLGGILKASRIGKRGCVISLRARPSRMTTSPECFRPRSRS